jgi:ABC-type multidrug transport system ATPase subunit
MLILRDLVKVYPGPVTALQGIHLEIPNGMFGLLGPNGAGKSTLMRIVAGILEPTSGTVTLDAIDVVREPDRVRAQLGYLPQDFGFYPHLTGRDMLVFLLRLKGVRARSLKKLADELLERVNLSSAARRKVKEYSGGMRQRLGIAQALAGSPRILIVDEPTAGLDPEERLRFYHLLADLAANRIVLLSTHIVEDVAVLCPRFALIREGRLIVETSPSEALGSIAGAIFEAQLPREELDDVRRTHMVTQAVLFEGKNRVRVFSPDGTPPAGFQPGTATLEDAYLVLARTDGRVLPASAEIEARLAGSPS